MGGELLRTEDGANLRIMPKAGQSTMWQPCIPTFCKLYILEHVCELNKVQITEHLQTVHLNTLRKVFSRVYLGVLIWPL